MSTQTISLLATLAIYADEKTLTQWVELLLPKEVVKNMEHYEKYEYLQEVRFEGR